jgi:hypothetical protein
LRYRCCLGFRLLPIEQLCGTVTKLLFLVDLDAGPDDCFVTGICILLIFVYANN